MSKKKIDKFTNPGYELSDTTFKPTLISGIAFFALAAAGLALMAGLFLFYKSRAESKEVTKSPLAAERYLPEGPRLQVDPDLDWVLFKAKQDSVLNSVGWVGKDAGLVRIPIERAMEIALERGFPSRKNSGSSNVK